MANQVVMVGTDDVAAQIAWAEANGLRASHIRIPVFVDLTDRVIHAGHIVTDDEHANDDFPKQIRGRQFGIGSLPIDDQSDLLTVAREWPLLVDPPESIIV